MFLGCCYALRGLWWSANERATKGNTQARAHVGLGAADCLCVALDHAGYAYYVLWQ